MFIQETLTGMSSSLPKITISFESFNLCLFDNFFFACRPFIQKYTCRTGREGVPPQVLKKADLSEVVHTHIIFENGFRKRCYPLHFEVAFYYL